MRCAKWFCPWVKALDVPRESCVYGSPQLAFALHQERLATKKCREEITWVVVVSHQVSAKTYDLTWHTKTQLGVSNRCEWIATISGSARENGSECS